MSQRNQWMLCACAAALAAAGEARAQTAPAATAAPAAPATAIGEVIVTAQRRAESAQNVPISITTFNNERLARAAVQSLPDLARVTPGLQFQAIGANSAPFLRGVGAATTSAGAESAVALVVDGVYVSSQPASLMALSNIQSVEVDRGPQGTLFGRNATGGVIQINTLRPGRQPKFDATVGYGNYGTWDGTFYGSMPLTDTVAADLSIYAHDQTEGYGKNLFDGSDIYRGYDYAFRSKWYWAATPTTDVTFIGNYETIRNETGFATRLPRLGELGLNQIGRGGFRYTGGFYDVNLNFPSYARTETGGASLDIEQKLGDVAKLRSITAYQKLRSHQQVDFDLTPNWGSHQILQDREDTASEEIQILSPDTNSRLNWVAGAYLYRNIAAYEPVDIMYPPNPVLSETILHTKQNTSSWSLFGQGTYKVFDDTRLTVGLRYTEDSRDFVGWQRSLGPVPGPLVQTGSKTFPKLTYHFAVDHRFADKILTYVQFTRGFKAGFFNTTSIQPPGNPHALVVQPETIDSLEVGEKSDWLDRRLRVNLSAFYYNYANQQVNAFLGATRQLLNAANSHIKGLDLEIVAAPIEHLTVSFNGELLDARYHNFPGAPVFTPLAAVGPAGAVGNLVTATNARGKRVINSPGFTGTFSATYTIPTDFGKVDLSGDLYHNSGYYFDFLNTRRQNAYQYLSASAKFVFDDGRYDVTFWGANLLNQEVYASVNQVGAGPAGLFGGDSLTPRAPRTYGVRVGAHF